MTENGRWQDMSARLEADQAHAPEPDPTDIEAINERLAEARLRR